MSVLPSAADPASVSFAANAAAMRALVGDLRDRVARVESGGGDEARRRHLGRGKLLPRERVRTLLDPSSPFLELSQLAAYGLCGGDIASAGIITGIGPAPARQSYIDQEALLAAAADTSAEAIHPGYGFLAENADFAESCKATGILFVGPPSSAIRAMGQKAHAKTIMVQAGVPVLPGYDGERQVAEGDELLVFAGESG